jgi:hypothetical protein
VRGIGVVDEISQQADHIGFQISIYSVDGAQKERIADFTASFGASWFVRVVDVAEHYDFGFQ